MRELTSYETSRLAVQEARDSEKTQDERNRLGQFATPTALALDILAYSTELLQANEKIRFLDPAIGTGSFYSALLATVPLERISEATGFEIDDHYGDPARTLWADTLLRLNLADFTKAKAPPKEGERCNLLVCNPPYVRHHHLSATEKLRLQEAVVRTLSVRLSGLAGLYCYFMCLSHDWMTQGGVAAWLIPSEFMDVNYGRALKRYLLDQVTLLRVHRSDPNDLQFREALVSSAIVWFRKASPQAGHVVEFSFGGTIRTPNKVSLIEVDVLRTENKWTRFPMLSSRSEAPLVKLGDLFAIKRGLATGANQFFVLTRDKIEELKLPREVFRPILPSPRYLAEDEVRADEHGNPILSPQLFLLDCSLSEPEVKLRYPSLWRYLQSGKPEIANRYLCRARELWYSQEKRPPSQFLCTYMGRSDCKAGRPFRFILNHSKATVANVYLVLYPKPALVSELTQNPELARGLWKALNNINPTTMVGEGRVYGGGLHKLEPSELANVPIGDAENLLRKVTDIRSPQMALFIRDISARYISTTKRKSRGRG